MDKRTKIIIGGAAIAAATAGGAGVVLAAGAADDGEAPITGDDLDRASAVALDHLGGGTVTGTEIGDEDSYYEVEVTLEDGRQVDVQLDEAFEVVRDMADSENEPGDPN